MASPGKRHRFNGWRPALFSLLLIGGVFFLLVFSRTPEASAARAEKPASGAMSAVPAIPPRNELERTVAELKRGSNLHALLLDRGISPSDAAGVITAVEPYLNLRKLQAGQKVELLYENRYFAGVMIPASIDRDIQVIRSEGSLFRAAENLKDLQTLPSSTTAVVESSLYGSAAAAGIPDAVIMDLILLFSFDVDFQRDIQKGDEISVTYEKLYDETGRFVDTGNILFASLKTNGQNLEVYRFVSPDGKADFFNKDGETVRKTLLKTPIHGAYITSNFGLRVNPFSGYTTMHKGVDFGAPRGTPIKASGDGTVTYVGYNDVYGNHVRIRHVNQYSTLYAHMTSFGRGMRRGVRVDQGQVIGYVGSTGMSTGPHLHYEVRYNGRQVNPSTVKFPPGRTLEGGELRLFRNLLNSYNASFQ